MDDVLEKEGFGEFVEVDVGELNDTKTMKWFREIPDAHGRVDQIDFMARDLAGVQCEACSGYSGTKNEFATG
jgi:hypothetical protein